MTAVLEAADLSKHFPARAASLAATRNVRAVDGFFAIQSGKTLGVVGSPAAARPRRPSWCWGSRRRPAAAILFEGRDLGRAGCGRPRHYRKSVQAVFQDPYASLSPRMRTAA